ncbi:MAG: restriction endonuclease [Myxococcales bacterium]|nr:restriction endonuclease [Myxococcales bacterium]
MTFLEAALHILGREGKPLHFKELTEKAVNKKLLTFVGRTPEVTMQTQLTAAVKKAPGNPFVRVKPGVFGLLRYPEIGELEPVAEVVAPEEAPLVAETSSEAEAPEARRRRTRRGRRGRDRDESAESEAPGRQGPGDDSPAVATVEELEERGAEMGSSRPEPLPLPAPPRAFVSKGVEADAPGSDEAGHEDDDGELAEGDELAAGEAGGAEGDGPGRRRRRRRRRRRGGAVDANGLAVEPGSFTDDFASLPTDGAGDGDFGVGVPEGAPVVEAVSEGPRDVPTVSDDGPGRRIMAPLDAAIEVLRGQAPGRGVHVRQIADTAVRRRLVHGEAHEAWRVMRAALAAESKERLRAGLRPRIRAAGSGLFALARRPADMDLEKAESVYGEAVRALRERTLASLEQRLGELASGAFEALARVLLQREGFGPATFVKRVEGTVYLEALRGRGWKPSKCLVALRWGSSPAGRRAVGELRAGVRARNADEGVLLLAGRLSEEAIREWKQPGPPIEVVDGPAMSEACARHGVGVINAQVNVDFVDADFFAELSEG